MYNLIMKNRLTAEETAQKHYEKMTQTPVVKLIVQLGLPTTLSMLITNIYNMADTYFVGTLGQSEQGAIGIVFTLQAIIQAVAFTLGHGSGTYVAKELADKNTQKATTYVSSAFFLGGAFGIVFGVFGLIFLQPFMRLLGSTETILPHACDYGMWALISCPFLICSLVLNNNLRYEGKAFFSMIGLVSGGVLNIALDYVFVVICNMGVFGAGMATAISQVVSFGLLLFFYMKMAQSTISVKEVSKDVKQYLAIFRTGAPSFVRQGMNAISGGVLNHLARYYGGLVDAADATIDAMSIVNRVSSLVFCVGLGICQGLQPVASYNYQLKLYSRVKKALGATCIICFAIILMFGNSRLDFCRTDSKVYSKRTIHGRHSHTGTTLCNGRFDFYASVFTAEYDVSKYSQSGSCNVPCSAPQRNCVYPHYFCACIHAANNRNSACATGVRRDNRADKHSVSNYLFHKNAQRRKRRSCVEKLD